MAKIRAKRTSPSFSEAFLLSICKKSARLHFFFLPLFLSFWEHWHLTGLIATYASLSTKIFLPSHWRFLLWVNYFMFFRVGNPLVMSKLPKKDIFNPPSDPKNALPLREVKYQNSFFCNSNCRFRFIKVSTQTSLLFFKFLWDHCQKRQNSSKIGLIKLTLIFQVIGIFDNVPIRIFNKED